MVPIGIESVCLLDHFWPMYHKIHPWRGSIWIVRKNLFFCPGTVATNINPYRHRGKVPFGGFTDGKLHVMRTWCRFWLLKVMMKSNFDRTSRLGANMVFSILNLSWLKKCYGASKKNLPCISFKSKQKTRGKLQLVLSYPSWRYFLSLLPGLRGVHQVAPAHFCPFCIELEDIIDRLRDNCEEVFQWLPFQKSLFLLLSKYDFCHRTAGLVSPSKTKKMHYLLIKSSF